MSPEPASEELALQQKRSTLARAGRLHLGHWAVVLSSLALTVAAWRFSSDQVAEKVRDQFDHEQEQVTALIRERMELYENALWAGVGALLAQGGDMALEDWVTFSDVLQIDRRYRGINGIGVIDHLPATSLDTYLREQRATRPDFRVFPRHDQPWLWPIRFIEPVSANSAAVGLDIGHESNRRRAAERALETGQAQITGPIILVQDEAKTAGFLFYAPYDASSGRHAPKAHGLVYAPFIVKKLLEGTLEKERRHVGLRIADAGEVIYDELDPSNPGYDPEALYSATTSIEMYGRRWDFEIHSTQAFRGLVSRSQPTLILCGGLAIDALLLALFLMLSRSNRRALAFADQMAAEANRTAAELRRSNEDLERFAYVASHDLKTPLRGVSDLAEYLEEDLHEYLQSEAANPAIQKNLERLHGQVRRMDALIQGILEYSSAGADPAAVESVDPAELLTRIVRSHALDEDRVHARIGPASIRVHAVPFEQVLTNLITNAFKHHPDPSSAEVEVTIEETESLYRVSVSDDGKGIDPRFHKRIFETFQTLQPKDVVEGTGIGLSIVQKIVQGVGGSIEVESSVGAGTRFTFTWPRS